MLQTEQRKWPRTKTPAYLVSFEQIAGRGYGDMKDFSVGGLAFKSPESVELGAITLHFKMPFFDRRKTVHGEVVWFDRDSFTCGVNFHLSF